MLLIHVDVRILVITRLALRARGGLQSDRAWADFALPLRGYIRHDVEHIMSPVSSAASFP